MNLMELMQQDETQLIKKMRNPNFVVPEPESVKLAGLQLKRKNPPLNMLIGEENNPMSGEDAEALRNFYKLSRDGGSL